AYEQLEGQVYADLRAQFKPEFLNRVDETVIFHSLSRDQIKEIVDIQLAHVRRYLEERHIALDLTEAAREFLATEGYDPAFGARPLKRAIQRRILDALATEILKGAVAEGDRVTADVAARGNGLTFKVRTHAS
ncbi:MAG: type VI secretion system ATPase TssH, partial [Verrucomicrobia bacterium]|nr:type VI secretion system ATPase TssH [Verrucomicrobiota bacterium]